MSVRGGREQVAFACRVGGGGFELAAIGGLRQIAVEPGDANAAATALRETVEEIGLARELIEPIGAWDRYDTITGFRITPIVGLIEPGFSLTLNPREVASVFEAPLSYLFDPANHERRSAIWRGAERHYYAMPYQGRFIWGATAGMIRALWERLYG